MGEEEKVFSDVQRDIIYKETLQPIKAKISEILLYDTEAAMRFLQKYNDILKCTNDKDMFAKSVDLELEISTYEKNDGLQKSFDEKSKSIIQQIKDMQIDGDKLSLEDFEDEFKGLKQTYQSAFQKYSFQARDAIEHQLYELYGKVMIRRAREGATDEIEIPKEDVIGLTVFVNNEIGKLSQNSNPQVQNAVERIKFKLMDKESAFQDDEIWKLLSYAQSQKDLGPKQPNRDSNQPQVTALAVVKQKTGLASRIKKSFQREPQLPLQVEDVSKITLDWLAQHIPEDMLMQIEEERLKEEGRNPESKYLPYPKVAIYEFFSDPSSKRKLLRNKGEVECENGEFEYEYEDQLGNKQRIQYFHDWGMELMRWKTIELDKDYKVIHCRRNGKEGASLYNLTIYTCFLDNIFGTNLVSQLIRDYGEFIQKPKKTFTTKIVHSFVYGSEKYDGVRNNYYDMRDIAAQSELFKNLLKSYSSISKECKETEIDFNANEEYERRTFYEKNKFREGIRQITDGQSPRGIQEDIQPKTKGIPKRMDRGEKS